MKRVVCIIILSVVCMSAQAFVHYRSMVIQADTAIHPSRDKLSKDILQLRDSINTTIGKIAQQAAKSTAIHRKVLTKADNELVLRRAELEKVLDEVVIATARTWDENLRIRAIQAIRDGRRDYYRILDDIRQAMTAGSSR